MKQSPAVLTPAMLTSATWHSASRVQQWIDLAAAVQADKRKEERLRAQECKACFYTTRMGGAAMTSRACMCCGKEQLFGSTNTGVLCPECAKQHQLCKHCGSDIELRTDRKDWPVAELNQNKEAPDAN